MIRRRRRPPSAWLAAALAAAVLVACESKVTRENFDQIRLGMSLTEVTAILGSGTEESPSSGTSVDAAGLMSRSGGESQDRTFVWKDGGKKIVVTFAKGRVVAMHHEGL